MKKLIAIGLAAVLALGLLALPVTASVGYTICLEPYMDGNLMGEDHTVTATVLDLGDNPVAGVNVTFWIEYGPNYEGPHTDIANLHTALTDANGQASWTYTGAMECGEEGIIAWANYDEDPLFDDEPWDEAYKYWLTDKFSGGGKIIQEGQGKSKTWPKITWGGWAGTTCYGNNNAVANFNGYYPVGEFEVTFHNVGNDDLDKAKFVSWWVNYLDYADFSNDCPGADPPPSEANFAQVSLFGQIEDKNGSVIGYGTLVINGMDNGEPGNIDEDAEVTSDGIRFILFSGGSRIYDSYLSGDFLADQADPCSDNGVRHELDSGNLQIVVPPLMPI